MAEVNRPIGDKELLELAARAAIAAGDEIEIHGGSNSPMVYKDGWLTLRGWNPLEDDGDALRLAAKLSLDLMFTETDVEVIDGTAPHCNIYSDRYLYAIESLGNDRLAATRRAIVRCAAEIGRLT